MSPANIYHSVKLGFDSLHWAYIPLFIQVCLVISVIALVSIIIAIIHIAMDRIQMRLYAKERENISKEVNMLLMIAILNPENGEPDLSFDYSLKQFNSKPISRTVTKQVLVEGMLAYRNNFTGKIAARTRKLYLSLSLERDAFKRISSRFWETKVAALLELYNMNVPVNKEILLRLVNDRNKRIREVARLSLIKYNDSDPLQYLRDLDEPLSKWEEFEIFQVFKRKTNYTLSEMNGLLSLEKDPTVVSLCLKLAVLFNQQSSIELIKTLVKSPVIKLRAEAIETLGLLHATKLEDYLVSLYSTQPHEVQLSILVSISSMRTGKHLDFIENEFIRSNNFEIKKYASETLVKLYPLSSSVIDRLIDTSKSDNLRMLNYSLNPLINVA